MAEFVKFSHQRLLVGFRRRDWTKVWYEPFLEGINVNEDGDVPIALYQYVRGEAQAREPLEAEISWFPFYQPQNFQAVGPGAERARKIMQQRYLWDCWRYMAEQDAAKVAQLEDTLDNPNDRQWQAWFDMARKAKKKQAGARAARRSARRQTAVELAEATGQTVSEIAINSDTSDASDDSGIGSDHVSGRRERQIEMPPPRPLQTPVSKKRSNPPGGRKSGPKKPRKGKGGKGSDDGGRPAASLPRRSGPTPRPGGGRSSVDIDSEDDHPDTASSVDFDGRPPETPSRAASAIGFLDGPANEFDGREYLMASREGLTLDDSGFPATEADEENALRLAIRASMDPEARN